MAHKKLDLVNSGKCTITIKNELGEKLHTIYTIREMCRVFLDYKIFQPRTSEVVKRWFNSTVTNYIRCGFPNIPQDIMLQEDINDIFLVTINDFIDRLVSSNEITRQFVIDQLPPFVTTGNESVMIFGSGDIFSLFELTENFVEVEEYLSAVVSNTKNRNDVLMPPQFTLRNIIGAPVVEVIKRCAAWHTYTAQHSAKVSHEEAMVIINKQVEGLDYKLITKTTNNCEIVKILNAATAADEGKIMKHCVGTYGDDIECNRITIYSLRDRDGLPQATFTIKNKTITQLKGRHNTTIKPEFHIPMQKYVERYNLNITSGASNIGL